MYNRTFWKNRSVEHPHRYTDETGQEKTFTQAPGTVYEAGTPMEQGKLNNQETGIAAVYAAVLFLVQQVGLLMTKVQANVTAVASNILLIQKYKTKSTTATLTVAGWAASGEVFTQTLSVAIIPASCALHTGPDETSREEYIACDVHASASSAGSITYTATKVPENALTVNIAISEVDA